MKILLSHLYCVRIQCIYDQFAIILDQKYDQNTFNYSFKHDTIPMFLYRRFKVENKRNTLLKYCVCKKNI